MKQFRKTLPLVGALSLFLSCFSVSAQNSLIGREFLFSVLGGEAQAGEVPTVFVTMSAAYPDDQKGKVVLTVPSTNESVTFEYNGRLSQAPVVWGYEVDERTFMGIKEGKDPFSIHVEADIDITVLLTKHYRGEDYNHGDGTMVLPVRELGTQYYVMSHNELTDQLNSEIVIVATRDDTYIDIIPSVDTRAHPAGFPFTIKLDRGERFQVQSKGDLTGTFIELNTDFDETCKPFAVFSGASRTTIGNKTNEGHIFTQVYSTDKWGSSFSLLPFELDSSAYLVKILAYENNTEVERTTADNSNTILLNSGEFATMTFNEAVKIKANKKILLAQYFMGFDEDLKGTDPFILLPIADQHFSSELSLNWGPNSSFRRLVQQADPNARIPPFHSIIMQETDTSFFTHRSSGFKQGMKTFEPNEALVYSNFYPSLTFDGFELSQKSPHALHLFTFGKIPFTVNLGIKANVLFVPSDSLSLDVSEVVLLADDSEAACMEKNLFFQSKYTGKDSNNPPRFFFEWDFGDGNKKEGEDVYYQYQTPGTYTVSLRTLGNSTGCIEENIVNHQLTVIDTKIKKLNGADEVCPYAQNAIYSVDAHPDNTYTWEVVGGTLVSASGNQAVINWDGPNPNAQVKVISSNPYSCAPEEVILNVNLDPNSLPGIPQGKSLVCTNETIQEYEVPFTFANSTYLWEVTNGQILEGDGSGKIKVEWNGVGKGSLNYTKTSNGSSGGCNGQSPLLEVDIIEPANLNVSLTNITCEGATDGEIMLSLEASSGPYEVIWEDGSRGLNRSGLDIGDYEATITDGSGCTIIWNGAITREDVLDVQMNISDGTCYGANDGSNTLNITGGVEPYQVFWDGSLNPRGISATQLLPGIHQVRVKDARGCEIKASFDIKEPELFEVSVNTTSTCPGENTGSVTVNARGGQGPYEYSWNGEAFSSEFEKVDISANSYDIVVRDASGCQVRLSNVEVLERQRSLKLPNAFTPNGDGVNDVFEVIFDCTVKSFFMQIYTKWGEVVYSSEQLDSSWDGTLNNKPVSGSFVYIARYVTHLNGQDVEEVLRGNVQVIR